MDNAPQNDASQVFPTEGTGQSERRTTADESATVLRLRRIEDLQANALAKADPLEASLGAANGALLRVGMRLEENIERAWASMTDPADRFVRIAPTIESLLKVMRQVDRLAQLDQRLNSARQTGNTLKAR
jgi:hypothetical protein